MRAWLAGVGLQLTEVMMTSMSAQDCEVELKTGPSQRVMGIVLNGFGLGGGGGGHRRDADYDIGGVCVESSRVVSRLCVCRVCRLLQDADTPLSDSAQERKGSLDLSCAIDGAKARQQPNLDPRSRGHSAAGHSESAPPACQGPAHCQAAYHAQQGCQG